MTALVTGAAGHLGNNVVRQLLARGRRVRVLVHAQSASLDGLPVEVRPGDILERSSLDRAFEGVEVVYHFAAKVTYFPSDDASVTRTNILGPKNVVDACLTHKVRRLVHASSIHALNLSRRAAAYDRSKAAGEAEVRAGIERGLDAVIVNPTGVIGPHDYAPHLTGRALLDMFLGRLPMGIAGGFNWVDARDVAAGALSAEARGRSGENYVLSGRWAGLRELAAMMHASTGRRGPRVVAPLWLAWAGLPFVGAYARLTGSKPLYTRPALQALAEHRDCDNAKARGELGFVPRPLERTIAETFAFYAKAGLLTPGARHGTSLPAGEFN